MAIVQTFRLILVCLQPIWLSPMSGFVSPVQDETIRFSRLQDPVHREFLRLSEEQVQKIDAIAKELADFRQQLKGNENAQKEMRDRERAGHERCLKLLDDDQKYRDKLLVLAFKYGFGTPWDELDGQKDELELTVEQRKLVYEKLRSQITQRFTILEKELNGILNEELARDILQRDASEQLQRNDVETELKLNAAQRKRSAELGWRKTMLREGLEFFARAEVQEWLQFTDEEKVKLSHKLGEVNKSENRFDRLKKTHGEPCKEYCRSLPPEQIARLKELVGPPPKEGTVLERLDFLK